MSGRARKLPKRFTDQEPGETNILKLKLQLEEMKRKNLALEKEVALCRRSPSRSSQNTTSINPVSTQISLRLGTEEVTKIIPLFNPSNSASLNASQWVETIENIRHLYEWDDRSTLFYASLRLGDAATNWFAGYRGEISTWDDFKIKILRDFSSEENSADVHVKLLSRQKDETESYESYVYEMAAMGKRGKLDNNAIIKYIISGLRDTTLMSNLITANCNSIPDLLTTIKSLKDIQKQAETRQRFENSIISKNIHRPVLKPYYNNSIRMQTPYFKNQFTQICYNCRSPGHLASECKSSFREKNPKYRQINNSFRSPGHFASEGRNRNRENYQPLAYNPKHQNFQNQRKEPICYNCQVAGHLSRDCKKRHHPFKRDQVSEEPPRKIHRLHRVEDEGGLLQNIDVDGHTMKAFVDLGSDCTTIKQSEVQKLGWEMLYCNTQLQGFGMRCNNAIGKIIKNVTLGEVTLKIDILVVQDQLQDYQMILGRNFLDSDKVCLTRRSGVLTITHTEKNM